MAARCDTSQMKSSFLAAVTALEAGKQVDMDGMVGVHLQKLSGNQFHGFRPAPAAFANFKDGSERLRRSSFCGLDIPWGKNLGHICSMKDGPCPIQAP